MAPVVVEAIASVAIGVWHVGSIVGDDRQANQANALAGKSGEGLFGKVVQGSLQRLGLSSLPFR